MGCELNRRDMAQVRAARNWFYRRHGVDETVQEVKKSRSFTGGIVFSKSSYEITSPTGEEAVRSSSAEQIVVNEVIGDSTPQEPVAEKPKFNYPRVPY